MVHAPGSLLTYEPQWNSDVGAIFENVTSGEINPRQLLVDDVPDDRKQDVDYLIDLMDWEKNIDPLFPRTLFPPARPDPANGRRVLGKMDHYGNPYFSAKELSVAPGATVTVKDGAAYGCIFVQGHGTFWMYSMQKLPSYCDMGN